LIIVVKHLMVDPAHQRKGIGRQLLAAVVARSDAAGLPTFIMSSKEANQLYLRLGFEELGTAEIDNEYWAKEIVAHERALGIEGNEGLADMYEGKMEVERSLVRWVPSKPV
jgi:predicted N-acetyltransferase YhbS